MKLVWSEYDPPQTPQHGAMVDGVQVIVSVVDTNGEREAMVECLCPACQAMAQAGLPDGLEPGDHYLAHRVVTYPGGPWGATEYDGEWFYPSAEATP